MERRREDEWVYARKSVFFCFCGWKEGRSDREKGTEERDMNWVV
jgi:hypothetical protein